ncbi:glycoside hydrolase family 97 protein [Muricauda sp. CAU 1633]|uniref:glycoside hydrolase family 97 protein n=1 Tax=Allomuricauda sp. CAU 1633 TaxID=2816036 RepID=UPI001A8D5B6B|nr:glycoside hydrolase family 97 protein [Muricauda sp. CAU 1633]MBO0321804.1 glycoside hydrolase family 97 protein [Muricauda sp. CAU 1633]
MMKSFFWKCCIVFCWMGPSMLMGQHQITSPDGKLSVAVTSKEQLEISIGYNGQMLVSDIATDLNIVGKGSLVQTSRLRNADITTVNSVVEAIVPTKNRQIKDEYSQLTLYYSKFNFEVRCYNNGVAFRYVTKLGSKPIEVEYEKLDFSVQPDATCYLPEEKQLISHFENYFQVLPVSEIKPNTLANLPLLFTEENKPSISFTESNIYDYPHMFLHKQDSGFTSTFPNVVLKTKEGKRDRDEIIGEEANYIAKTSGNREFPWRVFMVSETDKDIVSNNLVYQLADPLKLEEVSWIQPGKVAWDWWNANNIDGVDFESGIDTQTYKYYIDFAAHYGLEYIILDEGWSKTTTNVKAPNPNIDVAELVAYGNQKNVGVILWSLWRPLDEDMAGILDQFQAWGVKGVKVDFIQRADQYVVNFYERLAQETAKRHMLVDFHGAFKPTGLRRAYPNVINYEGVKGLENTKWEDKITSEHELTLPFTRMTAGILDFTPGGLDNVHKENFMARFDRPMAMGTRAHQVAMYVVYEAPLQMLSDTPSNYYREDETTSFIAKIPTTWDDTVVLEAKVSDYILLARKNGNTWYVAGMNDDTPKEFTLDFSFLGEGNYKIQIFKDGINSDKNARDYVVEEATVNSNTTMDIKLNKSGGWVAIATKM